jgi:glucokinase
VIAPGTGLGEAFLIWNGRRYQPCSSEGGHASFGPETPLELELLNYLWPRFGHVSFERVCSGIGVFNLYTFLRDGKGYHEPQWLSERLADASDPNPIIAQAAIENKAEICAKTLDLFISIMGSEAATWPSKSWRRADLPGRGIPPRILPQLKKKTFREAFTNKGRFAGMLMNVPVYVISHKQAALFGAACHGLQPG